MQPSRSERPRLATITAQLTSQAMQNLVALSTRAAHSAGGE